jgi:hypothetical protein
VPDASVGSGEWLGIVVWSNSNPGAGNSAGKKERHDYPEFDSFALPVDNLRAPWSRPDLTLTNKVGGDSKKHQRKNSTHNTAENRNDAFERDGFQMCSDLPNVAMIRAKDGATPAPQEECQTQASDPVSGSA